jgi:hypothetical protein
VEAIFNSVILPCPFIFLKAVSSRSLKDSNIFSVIIFIEKIKKSEQKYSLARANLQKSYRETGRQNAKNISEKIQ